MLTIPLSDSRFIDAWLIVAKKNAEEMFNNIIRKEVQAPVPVRFTLIDSPDINACAKLEFDVKGKISGYLVEVNEGMVRAIGENIKSLLSQKEVISDLGNVTKKNNTVILSTDRATAMFDMLNVSLYFVILHELGHIYFGHLDWYDEQFNCRCIQEKEIDKLTDPITHQVIEILADTYALAKSSSTYFVNSLSARCAGFGLGVVLELLSDQSYGLSEYEQCYHPHPLVRSINTIINWHEGSNYLVDEKLVEAWLSGLLESLVGHDKIRKEVLFEGPWQDAFSEMIEINAEMNPDEIEIHSSKIAMKHYLRLLNRSKPLVEELRPYFWDSKYK